MGTSNSLLDMTHMVYASQVEQALLNAFLHSQYSPPKSSFLIDHSAWWYAGDANRWVLLVNKKMAGYCAVLPANIHILGKRIPAIWWVDLVLAREFRGQGLQTAFDQKIHQMDILTLGVPNALAAEIHRKHGWGLREDFHVLLLPLRPLRIKSLQRFRGLMRWLLTLSTALAAPAAWLWRKKFQGFSSKLALQQEHPSPQVLADIFERYCPPKMVTTWRDVAHFDHRFFKAPYRDELRFYLAGNPQSPTHYLIARHMRLGNQKLVRILDMFGDFTDTESFHDMLCLAIRDADAWRASQITVLNTSPALQSIFRVLGFWLRSKMRFCWTPLDYLGLNAFQGDLYLTLADSDNDSPD